MPIRFFTSLLGKLVGSNKSNAPATPHPLAKDGVGVGDYIVTVLGLPAGGKSQLFYSFYDLNWPNANWLKKYLNNNLSVVGNADLTERREKEYGAKFPGNYAPTQNKIAIRASFGKANIHFYDIPGEWCKPASNAVAVGAEPAGPHDTLNVSLKPIVQSTDLFLVCLPPEHLAEVPQLQLSGLLRNIRNQFASGCPNFIFVLTKADQYGPNKEVEHPLSKEELSTWLPKSSETLAESVQSLGKVSGYFVTALPDYDSFYGSNEGKSEQKFYYRRGIPQLYRQILEHARWERDIGRWRMWILPAVLFAFTIVLLYSAYETGAREVAYKAFNDTFFTGQPRRSTTEQEMANFVLSGVDSKFDTLTTPVQESDEDAVKALKLELTNPQTEIGTYVHRGHRLALLSVPLNPSHSGAGEESNSPKVETDAKFLGETETAAQKALDTVFKFRKETVDLLTKVSNLHVACTELESAIEPAQIKKKIEDLKGGAFVSDIVSCLEKVGEIAFDSKEETALAGSIVGRIRDDLIHSVGNSYGFRIAAIAEIGRDDNRLEVSRFTKHLGFSKTDLFSAVSDTSKLTIAPAVSLGEQGATGIPFLITVAADKKELRWLELNGQTAPDHFLIWFATTLSKSPNNFGIRIKQPGLNPNSIENSVIAILPPSDYTLSPKPATPKPAG